MRLGRRPHQLAAHLGDATGDVEPATTKVNTTDGQCGQLAEPKASEGENSHWETIIASRLDQDSDVLGREEPRLRADLSWEPNALGGVAGNAAVSHSGVQNEGQDPMDLPNAAGPQPLGVQARDPGGDIGVPDLGQRPIAPLREDVAVEDAPVPRRSRHLEVYEAVRPGGGDLAQPYPAGGWVDVLPAVYPCLHLVKPPLGIDATRKRPLSLPPTRITPTRQPSPIARIPRDSGHQQARSRSCAQRRTASGSNLRCLPIRIAGGPSLRTRHW